MNNQVIGFCGLNGSGKTTAAQYLVDIGYKSISLSDYIKESLKKTHKKPTRENMIEEGNRLRKENGSEYLAKLAVEQINTLQDNHFVIDSIRNGYEVKYLKDNLKNFHLVKINTELAARYFRIDCRENLRGGEKKDNLVTIEKFKEDQKKEFSTYGKNNVYAQHLDLVMKWADCTIKNNGTVEEFQEEIRNLLVDYKNEKVLYQ